MGSGARRRQPVSPLEAMPGWMRSLKGFDQLTLKRVDSGERPEGDTIIAKTESALLKPSRVRLESLKVQPCSKRWKRFSKFGWTARFGAGANSRPISVLEVFQKASISRITSLDVQAARNQDHSEMFTDPLAWMLLSK